MAREIRYIDPFSEGHHPEQLAFYGRIAANLGVRLRVETSQSTWKLAQPMLGEAAKSLSLDRAVDVGLGQFRDMLSYMYEVMNPSRGQAPIFFPMLDPFIAPLALLPAGRTRNATWSGVYFRDGFNYPAADFSKATDFFKYSIKLGLLRIASNKRCVEILTYNESWRKTLPAPTRWLPDALSELDALRDTQPIAASAPRAGERDRVFFVLFGALKERKGVLETLDGFRNLPAHELSRINLKILGKFTDQDYRSKVMSRIDALSIEGGAVTIKEGYIEGSELEAAISEADVVLAPYIDHMGSSGVLGIAARYGKPVLTQSAFQVGEETRRFGLGLTADIRKPLEVRSALSHLIHGYPLSKSRLGEYLQRRSPERAKQVARESFELLLQKKM